MPKIHYPYVIGIDWLQLYVLNHYSFPEDKEQRGQYIVTKKELRTRHYGLLLEFFYVDKSTRGEYLIKVGEMTTQPLSSILPPNAGHLKLENQILYTSKWHEYLKDILNLFDIEYRTISRVDVYYDCNKFYMGRTADRLIKDFLSCKILKIGSTKCSIHCDTLGYKIPSTTRKNQIECNYGRAEYSTITWGKITSGIQHQIYNKSKELAEGKFKSWIVDTWERAGLDISNVWRSEIRICKQGKNILLLESGDIFSLGYSEIRDQESIEELFMSYADKYFRFVKRDYHNRKQRMEAIKLYDYRSEKELSIKPKISRVKSFTSKTMKVVTNVLENCLQFVKLKLIRFQDKDIEYKLEGVKTFLASLGAYCPIIRPRTSSIDFFQNLSKVLLYESDQLNLYTSAALHYSLSHKTLLGSPYDKYGSYNFTELIE